jgi:hypothetical protein
VPSAGVKLSFLTQNACIVSTTWELWISWLTEVFVIWSLPQIFSVSYEDQQAKVACRSKFYTLFEYWFSVILHTMENPQNRGSVFITRWKSKIKIYILFAQTVFILRRHSQGAVTWNLGDWIIPTPLQTFISHN